MKNLIVGQSGGPTAVINSSLYGVIREGFNRSEEIEHVYGMINGIQGFLDGRFMDMKELDNDTLEALRTTTGAYLGSCRFKLPDDLNDAIYPLLFQKFEEMNIGYFFYIGGNDSMDTVSKLSRYAAAHNIDVRIMGIPKTIDNDLILTDHTPGFGSAAKYVAASVCEIGLDASVYNTKSVTIIEIMGRHAGWLAGAASLAAGADCNGPDIILLPERPFDENVFLEKVAQLEKDRHNVIIAASEGVKNKDGVFLCDLVSTAGQLDAFGHKAILSGTSRYLADLIHVRLGCKTRAIEFSTLQRCASHLASRTDITEAYQVGGASVEAAYRGETGKMCAIRRISDMPYRTETEMVDVQKVANLEKRVPDDWISPDGMHVTEAFHHYARPLIQAELTPIYIDGVPRHLHLH